MKVNVDIFKNFLERLNCGGKIEEVLLSFGEEGIYTKAVDAAFVIMLEVNLSNKVFTNYQAWGDVGITGLSRVINILGRFEKDVEILKEGNAIKIVGNREADIILPDTQFIKEVRNFPNIPFDVETVITTDVFKEADSNANVLKTKKFKIMTAGNVLTIETGDDDKMREKKLLSGSVKDTKVEVGEDLLSVIKTCGEKVTIKLLTDAPIVLNEQTENINAKYMIAPLK